MNRTPINRRLFGYNGKDIEKYWGQFSHDGVTRERRRLEIDLLFPLQYGMSLSGPL